MSLEGVLRIDLTLHGGRISAVNIASTRPVQASRIFHGKDPATVTQLIPRLFSVCGTAQACAAAHALAAARGRGLQRADLVAHQLLLLMEMAQEHAWRLCIDGARLCGEPPRMAPAAGARALLARLQRALFPNGGWEGAVLDAPDVRKSIDDLDHLLEEELFGVSAGAWCERLEQAPCWWSKGPDLPSRLLHSLEAQALADFGNTAPLFLAPSDAESIDGILADATADGFIATPTLGGDPRETTPLARHWESPTLAPSRASHGAGLATRFTALLLDLTGAPQKMRALLAHGAPDPVGSLSRRPGTGTAWVEAARGLLFHRVELEGDTINRYQILAPTEWNFHPRGVVARSVLGFAPSGTAQAKKASELIVQAIDPCVGFEVTLHA